MRIHHTLLAATMLALAAPALAGPAEDFQKLQDDYWAALLKNSPTLASSVGVMTYDIQLDVLGLGEMDRQAAEAGTFLARLNSIPLQSLSPSEQANYLILKRTLDNAVEA